MADDHQLFRKGLVNILNQSNEIEVVEEAGDGLEVLKALDVSSDYDLLLLDVNMPNMNGVEAVSRLKRRENDIPILMLTYEDSEPLAIQLLKLGVKGYVLKDASPDELKQAILTTSRGEYFINGRLSPKLIKLVMSEPGSKEQSVDRLTDRDIEFLKYCASECTYKEIAEKMQVSPRTVDGYRDSLFDRLNAKTRVGLALYAIKANLILV